MVDGNMTFGGAAAKEIKEETGLVIGRGDIENLSEIAMKKQKPTTHTWQAYGSKSSPSSDEKLADAFYLSPGGIDESMQAFYALKKLPRKEFEALNGKETGVATENEQITLKLVPLADVFFECQRDAKSLAALALYQNLKAKGLLKK
jgi:8-oxo-dGTP pyrophosphatase MutT (NUDIX family)